MAALRTPGVVNGLTDSDEGPFVKSQGNFSGFGIKFIGLNITNSFSWASHRGIIGPNIGLAFVGSNKQTWQNARDYQYASLTNYSSSAREERLAFMLYALGHTLHLNQDLSQPDHVRNDNHYVESRRYIENFGVQNYEKNPQWFSPQPHGWDYWRVSGFNKLLDFWDRGLYANGSSAALVQEAAGNLRLGLAEFSNGNFLGEDALYKEYFSVGDKHYFPFPSLNTSTDFRTQAGIGAGVRISHLKNGKPMNVFNVGKIADGISVANHSRLLFFGTGVSGRGSGQKLALVSSTINDSNVLQNYHDILIPKAVEYSAGILDYFFRGQLAVSIGTDADNHYVFTNINYTGESFLNGKFSLYQQDNTSGNRTFIQESTLTGELADSAAFLMTYTGSVPANTSFIMIYQGTIGTTNGVANDPVDAGIAIAVRQFSVGMYASTEQYYCACKNTPAGFDYHCVTVPAGAAYSTISVEDANSKVAAWFIGFWGNSCI